MEMFRLPTTYNEVVQRAELITKAGIYPEDRLKRCLDLSRRINEGKKTNDTNIEWIKNDFDKYGIDYIYRIEMSFIIMLTHINKI